MPQGRDDRPPTTISPDFDAVAGGLLHRAGGWLSVSQVAQLLATTDQDLQERICSGAAIGLTWGHEIVLPRCQFSEAGGAASLLAGIEEVTETFREASAGPWMELEFLIEVDPNLERSPLDLLREGAIDDVVEAAKARLHLEEG